MQGYMEGKMDYQALFEHLLHAETEDAVNAVLAEAGLDAEERDWKPLGMENNFAAIGNQQSDPTGALVEKVINGIDAVLMAQCFAHGIDPEGADAPQSMSNAVESFFGVREGRLEALGTSRQSALADNIHLVAVGSKDNPNYLIIDRGEGQTAQQFPQTFVSLLRSNKMRIPFVQGKFNAGGTGVLQFCGNRNYELIVSRRHPACPVDANDQTTTMWGFTLVRRLLPSGGRRSSMYVYLAPGGVVPYFQADSIKVLPGRSGQNRPATPYAGDLPFGTCVKLYNYRWRARSTLTTEGRYELQHYLHSPCLPFRVSETRDYRANYYSATIVGGWATAAAEADEGEGTKLEEGFPGYGVLTIDGIGELPYRLAVFKEGTKPRHVPNGVFFLVNGQVHGELAADFIQRKLNFDYLVGTSGPLLVSVDCTAMNERVREDFFMASRDRIRKNEAYAAIEQRLTAVLKGHPGLQEINQRRRQEAIERHVGDEAPVDALQNLLDMDPSLARLFALGDRLVTSTGPGPRPPFVGRRYPTFFRLVNNPAGGMVKQCPLNRTCRVEFETDAMNNYFERAEDKGRIEVTPPNLMESSHLWNGRFETHFCVPWNSEVGQQISVTVTVSDPEREARGAPFVCTFTLLAVEEIDEEPRSGGIRGSRRPSTTGDRREVGLAIPHIAEVRKDEWDKYGFDRYGAICVRNNGVGGYDCYINIDNAFLLTEVARAKTDDKPLVKYWYKFGLVLAAVGMIRNQLRRAMSSTGDGNGRTEHIDDEDAVDLAAIGTYCSGLAQVIVPIIRTLYHAPVLAGEYAS